jgi:hypothetical protein
MCCFSGKVERVANTRIFARIMSKSRQAIVYEMEYQAKDPVAMILPLPVPKGSQEKDVEFINLEKYPEFFADMKTGFPEPTPKGFGGGGGGFGGAFAGAVLEVQEVGAFEASYVPTLADFERLDERFRLPNATWEKLPAYKESGFAVFQLKPDNQKVHPMAFTFPRKANAPLFFPTVHIHDGEIHEKADFDHALYLQTAHDMQMLPDGWRESQQPAKMFLKTTVCKGLVAANSHCYYKPLLGNLRNRDTFIGT